MSTVAYAVLNRSESHVDGTLEWSTYIKVLVALVPAEVLAVHTTAVLFCTTTVEQNGTSVTTITNPDYLAVTGIALILLTLFIYWAKNYRKVTWDSLEYVRMLIPAVAFCLWMAFQTPSAFDVFFPGAGGGERYLTAAVLTVGLAIGCAVLPPSKPRSKPLRKSAAATVIHG